MGTEKKAGRGMRAARRGFVIGELLIALLLLAVAVSSLAALMYSVSRRPAAPAQAAARNAGGGPSKLLRSGCATSVGLAKPNCKDALLTGDSTDETILRARTDSTAMALLAKKEKERPVPRPDRGFIR
jgi:uncharacterized iron-regulated membrane protein